MKIMLLSSPICVYSCVFSELQLSRGASSKLGGLFTAMSLSQRSGPRSARQKLTAAAGSRAFNACRHVREGASERSESESVGSCTEGRYREPYREREREREGKKRERESCRDVSGER